MVPVGGPCSSSSECSFQSVGCINNVCAARGSGLVGHDSNIAGCQGGLVSDGGICRSQVGGTCIHSSDCASWTGGCRQGKCIPNQRRLNHPCSEDEPCNQGYRCHRGRCRIDHYSYIPCHNDSACASGSCVDGVCVL